MAAPGPKSALPLTSNTTCPPLTALTASLRSRIELGAAFDLALALVVAVAMVGSRELLL